MDAGNPERQLFLDAAEVLLKSLAEHYSTQGAEEAEGLLKHGSYSVRGGESPDDYTIWGDYYYFEALMRLERGIPGYWYEW